MRPQFVASRAYCQGCLTHPCQMREQPQFHSSPFITPYPLLLPFLFPFLCYSSLSYTDFSLPLDFPLPHLCTARKSGECYERNWILCTTNVKKEPISWHRMIQRLPKKHNFDQIPNSESWEVTIPTIGRRPWMQRRRRGLRTTRRIVCVCRQFVRCDVWERSVCRRADQLHCRPSCATYHSCFVEPYANTW